MSHGLCHSVCAGKDWAQMKWNALARQKKLTGKFLVVVQAMMVLDILPNRCDTYTVAKLVHRNLSDNHYNWLDTWLLLELY